MLRHQTLTLLVALATLALTALLYVAVPKGFFPVQDTGAIQAITEAPQSISFAAMAERQQALARAILDEPDVDRPVLVHRRRRHQRDAQQRPHADHAAAARRPRRERRPRSSRACATRLQTCPASRSTCSRCRS